MMTNKSNNKYFLKSEQCLQVRHAHTSVPKSNYLTSVPDIWRLSFHIPTKAKTGIYEL